MQVAQRSGILSCGRDLAVSHSQPGCWSCWTSRIFECPLNYSVLCARARVETDRQFPVVVNQSRIKMNMLFVFTGMSSLRNGGEPSTSKIPESADATKSTDDYEPVKPVKKTVIYKKTIVYNFTKVFAAKAEAATLKQLSSAERLLSADSQLSVAEGKMGLLSQPRLIGAT